MISLTAIRITACLMWTTAGLISGGVAGYLSAAATLMFLYTIILDKNSKVSYLMACEHEFVERAFWDSTDGKEKLDNRCAKCGVKDEA